MKNAILSIPVILFLFLFSGSFTLSAQEKYLAGLAYIQQDRLEEARDVFENLAGQGNDGAVLQLAEINYREGNTGAAIAELEKLESMNSETGYYLKAKIHAENGEAAAAVRYLRMHLASGYRLPRTEILLDESFYGIESSREWTELWKNEWYTEEEQLIQEVRYGIKNEDYLGTLEFMDSKRNDGDETAALLAVRAELLLAMDQRDAALRSYNSAIRMKPAVPEYLVGRSAVYASMEEHRKAAEDLERAYRLNPEDFSVLLQAGKARQLCGDVNAAINNAERFLFYFPEDIEANYLGGMFFYENAQYFQAIDRFNKCLGMNKSDPRFFRARGKCYLETSTYTYAVNDFGMSLDLDPSDPSTWLLRGDTRLTLGDTEGAISDWKRAARLGSLDAGRKLEEYAPR